MNYPIFVFVIGAGASIYWSAIGIKLLKGLIDKISES